MLKRHILLILSLFCLSDSFGQCSETFALSHESVDNFTCSIKFNFDLLSQNQYTSVTAIVRACDSLYQSNTIENISPDQAVNLEVFTSKDCMCNTFEPFLLFTRLDENDNLLSDQCFETPVTINFDNCPQIEVVDQSFLVVDDQLCDYITQIKVSSSLDFDQIDFLVTDCEEFESFFTLEDVIAGQDRSLQIDVSNSCGCDQLFIFPTLKRGDNSVRCNKAQLPIERIDFLPFPLELEKFVLNELDSKLFAEWSTLFEISLSEFIIEYSSDGFSFQELTKIEANQSENEYQIEVPNVEGYFRLKVINQNSEYGFTNVLYHKPDFNFAFFESKLLFDQPKHVQVINTQGQLIFSMTGTEVDLSSLPSSLLVFIFIEQDLFQKYFTP